MDNFLTEFEQVFSPTQVDGAAAEAKQAALFLAGRIVKVESQEEFDEAERVIKDLKTLVKGVSDAHKKAKEPILAASRALDGLKKEYAAELDAEADRIMRIAGDWRSRKLAEEAAAKRKILEEQMQIAQTGAEVAATQTSEEAKAAVLDATAATMIEAKAKAMAEINVSSVSSGTRLAKSWDVDVVDIRALYKAFPECVKLTPVMSAIKAKLSAGIAVPGVVAVESAKISVKTDGKVRL